MPECWNGRQDRLKICCSVGRGGSSPPSGTMNEIMNKNELFDSWGAPPIDEAESHMNPTHLQRLNYNPNYYNPDENELKIGDDIVIGTYASDLNGSPNIRWNETTVIGLPLKDYYPAYITCRKMIK
jgi:hypothetical protein